MRVSFSLYLSMYITYLHCMPRIANHIHLESQHRKRITSKQTHFVNSSNNLVVGYIPIYHQSVHFYPVRNFFFFSFFYFKINRSSNITMYFSYTYSISLSGRNNLIAYHRNTESLTDTACK